MSRDASVDFLWKTHSYLNECIRFADTKAELVIAWTSAMIGALLAGGQHKQIECSLVGLSNVSGLLFLAVAFTCAFVAVFPRMRTSQPKGFIFSESILAHASGEDYFDAFRKLSANDDSKSLIRPIAEHIYDLSGISRLKYLWVSRSIGAAFAGSALSAIAYLLRGG